MSSNLPSRICEGAISEKNGGGNCGMTRSEAK